MAPNPDHKLVDDSIWKEVRFINRPAVFMGYMSMLIRGTGFLVLTWSTVVLLGGFVSDLEEDDFWCITFITFVQTAGIFDADLNKKISYFGKQFWKVLCEVCHDILDWYREAKCRTIWVAVLSTILLILYAVDVAVLVLTSGAIYVFGLLISAGISFWRLAKPKKDKAAGCADKESPNLNPALRVVYSLAICQGMLFGSWFLFTFVFKRKVVYHDFDDKDYKYDTITECQKDPTTVKGRNLITYAVELMMDSSSTSSPDKFRSGLRALDIIVRQQQLTSSHISSELKGKHILMKHLVRAPSSSSSASHSILHMLLRALDLRGPHDREIRERAARIVAHLAGDIQLEQFPRGIHGISSLLSTLEEYRLLEPYERDWLLERQDHQKSWHEALFLRHEAWPASPHVDDNDARYTELMRQGLLILWKLAADHDNCTVMSNTRGLVPKIMAPVASDLVHHSVQDHGEEWSGVVEGSLRVMCRFMAAPGEACAKLRHEISSNTETIATVERILYCDKCTTDLKGLAMRTLTGLYMDASINSKGKEENIMMLLHIFADHEHKQDSSIRELAGEALAMLSSKGGTSATIILKENDHVVGDLATVLLDTSSKGCYRISAAKILDNLSSHYTKDDECLNKLKKSIIHAMPKVLDGLTEEENKKGKEDAVAPKSDIESPPVHPKEDAGGDSSSSSHQRKDKKEEFQEAVLLTTLLRLCVTICNRFISADQDSSRHFDAIAPASGNEEFNFQGKLEKIMVEINSRRPTVYSLSATRSIAKMVMPMMRHRDCCCTQDFQSLMASLHQASEALLHLDNSMVFASGDGDATTSMPPYMTLASLVKEAQGLVPAAAAATSSDVVET